MTECCILHCFRPATFQRLLDDAMSAKEIAAYSRQKKIDRLTEYATAYPKKIEVLQNFNSKINDIFLNLNLYSC